MANALRVIKVSCIAAKSSHYTDQYFIRVTTITLQLCSRVERGNCRRLVRTTQTVESFFSFSCLSALLSLVSHSVC